MTQEQAIQMAYDMGGHPYSVSSIASALMKGVEIGKEEQKVIDDDHLREATKMLIKKACDAHCRVCDYYYCCPYEFELEGCDERNEILKAMEE